MSGCRWRVKRSFKRFHQGSVPLGMGSTGWMGTRRRSWRSRRQSCQRYQASTAACIRSWSVSSTMPSTTTRLTTDQAPMAPSDASRVEASAPPIAPPAFTGAAASTRAEPVIKARNSAVRPAGRCHGRSGICSTARMTTQRPSVPVTRGIPHAPSPTISCKKRIQESVRRPRLSVNRLSRVRAEIAIRTRPHNSGRRRNSDSCCSVSCCRRDFLVRLLVAIRLA